MTLELVLLVISCIATVTGTVIATVSQGLNRDSLKSLRHSRLSGQKAVAPYLSGAGVLAAST